MTPYLESSTPMPRFASSTSNFQRRIFSNTGSLLVKCSMLMPFWPSNIVCRKNEETHWYQSSVAIWCVDDGALFSPDLVQFGWPPMRSRVWKFAPLHIFAKSSIIQPWIWPHDTPPTTRFQGQSVKGQGHSVTQQGQKFAKLAITQPRIVRFCSHFLQTIITWHRIYHKVSRPRGQMSTVTVSHNVLV